MEFQKFIGDKSINDNYVAVYKHEGGILLAHERGMENIAYSKFTTKGYERFIESIPDGVDNTSWVLDELFGCNILNKKEE